jgi:hypothetical protein
MDHGQSFTIVDTPGFDDSNRSDEDILRELLNWLQEQHGSKAKFNAVLFLHRIDVPRMQGSALLYFTIFKQLCGDAFYQNVFLGTTCWDRLEDPAVGEQREKELKEPGGFWYSIVKKGSTVVRIPQDAGAAREMVVGMASKRARFLQSQVEMGRKGLEDVYNSTLSSLKPEMEIIQQVHEEEILGEQEAFAKELQTREEKFARRAERIREINQRQLDQQEKERQYLLDAHEQSERAMKDGMKKLRRQTEKMILRNRLREQQKQDDLQADFDQKMFFIDIQRIQKAIALGVTHRGDVDSESDLLNCIFCDANWENRGAYGT